MINALSKLATKYSITMETTYANSSLYIARYQEQQTSGESFLSDMMEFTDHIAVFNDADSKLWVIDLVSGITPALTLNEGAIISQEPLRFGNVINKFVYNFTRLDASRATDSTPVLRQTPVQVISTTGKTNGSQSVVNPFSQPTTKSGGVISYDYVNVQTIIDRKATLYNKIPIRVVYDGFLTNSNGNLIGQSVSWSAVNDDERVNDGAGSMVITNFSYNDKDLTTTIEGIGTYTPVIK